MAIYDQIIFEPTTMKQNGDVLLFALINLVTGGAAAGMGLNILIKTPAFFTGTIAMAAGLCLVFFSWFITSAAHFRTHGATSWWSSRRLFKMSKSEAKLA